MKEKGILAPYLLSLVGRIFRRPKVPEVDKGSGYDLDGRSISGEVSADRIYGVLNGNDVSPTVQKALNEGDLEIVQKQSKPGLDNYALFVQRIKKPAVITGGIMGVGLTTFVAIKVTQELRRRRKQPK